MKATGKAVLIGHKSRFGDIDETVPLGHEYPVVLESRTTGVAYNKDTGESTPIEVILTQNRDGESWGWFPTDVLSIQDGEAQVH